MNVDTKNERKISGKKRESILKRDKHKCQVCGETKCLEVHHIKAIYLGGNSDDDNLITLCTICHKDAPEEGIEEFTKYKQNRIQYKANKILSNPLIKREFDGLVLQFLLMKLNIYLNNDIIDKNQLDKILNFEMGL